LDDFAFRLRRRGLDPVTDCRIELYRIDKDHTAIKSLFGARRVLGLEYLIHSGYAGDELRDRLARLGYDPGQVLAPKSQVYAENTREEANMTLRDLLTREALDYGLACSETAFVAVRKEAGRVIEGSVAVANALPAGWSDDFVVAAGSPAILCSLAAPPPTSPNPASPQSIAGPLFSLSRTNRASRLPAPDMFVMDSMESSMDQESARDAELAAPLPNRASLFSGRPQGSGEMILFDSSRDQADHSVRETGTINRLIISFAGGAPDAESLGAELCLLVFIDDLATPRAKVRLADLVRQGGARPLNLLRKPGETLRIALVDPTGVWSGGAPHIEVELEWR
jgi:Ca-activated chloride channel family protein